MGEGENGWGGGVWMSQNVSGGRGGGGLWGQGLVGGKVLGGWGALGYIK